MKEKLLIYANDLVLMERLFDQWTLNYGQDYSFYYSEDPEEALALLEETELDGLLTDDPNFNPSGLRRLVLLESPDQAQSQEGIFKYQSAEKIMADLKDRWGASPDQKEVEKLSQAQSEPTASMDKASPVQLPSRKKTLLYLSSFVGGSGVTSIGHAMAGLLSQRGLRVFYLVWDPWESLGQVGQADEMLFYLKSSSDRWHQALDKAIFQDPSGYHGLASASVARDALTLSRSQKNRIEEALYQKEDWQVMLIDEPGVSACDFQEELAPNSKVLFVSSSDAKAQAKTKRALASWHYGLESDSSPRPFLLWNKLGQESPQVAIPEAQWLGQIPFYQGDVSKQLVRDQTLIRAVERILT